MPTENRDEAALTPAADEAAAKTPVVETPPAPILAPVLPRLDTKVPANENGDTSKVIDALAGSNPTFLVKSALAVFFVNMALAWAVALWSQSTLQQSLLSPQDGADAPVTMLMKEAPKANANTMFLLHRILESALYHRLISNKQILLVVGMALAFGLMAVGFALYVVGARTAFQFGTSGSGGAKGGGSLQIALTATSPGILCFLLAAIIAVVALTRETEVKLGAFSVYPDYPQPAAEIPPPAKPAGQVDLDALRRAAQQAETRSPKSP